MAAGRPVSVSTSVLGAFLSARLVAQRLESAREPAVPRLVGLRLLDGGGERLLPAVRQRRESRARLRVALQGLLEVRRHAHRPWGAVERDVHVERVAAVDAPGGADLGAYAAHDIAAQE